MRPHYLGIAALGLVAGIATTMNGQVCQGTAPFSAGSARIGAAMQFTSGAKAYGAGLAFGSSNSLFASADYVHTQFDDLNAGSNGVDLQGGYSIAMNTSRSIQLCPIVGFAYQSGPDFDTGFGTVSSSIRAFAFGGSIGTTVPMSPTLDLVPFGGASYQLTHATSSLAGVSSSVDDNTTVLQAGAGFVFNKVMTIQPSVSLPTESGSKPVWSISFGFNFGTPAK
jgi:Outer membrane protein beta-barrel domain